MGARNRSLLVDVVAHLKVKVDASLASCVRPYCSALKALASLDREAAKGAEIRSCIKWVEEGETSSSYFIQLEKERAVDRWIPVLRESGGSIVSALEGLCCTLNSFYSDLFSSVLTDSVIQSSLLSYLPYFLPCDQAHLCEDLLTPDECFSTLKGMARNKALASTGSRWKSTFGSGMFSVLIWFLSLTLVFSPAPLLSPSIGVSSHYHLRRGTTWIRRTGALSLC